MSRDRVGALRVLCAVCVSAALALTLCSSALAAGKPVNVGTPFASLGPAVAVDGAGNAVIAHRHGTIQITAGVIEKVEKHSFTFSKTLRLKIKKTK